MCHTRPVVRAVSAPVGSQNHRVTLSSATSSVGGEQNTAVVGIRHFVKAESFAQPPIQFLLPFNSIVAGVRLTVELRHDLCIWKWCAVQTTPQDLGNPLMLASRSSLALCVCVCVCVAHQAMRFLKSATLNRDRSQFGRERIMEQSLSESSTVCSYLSCVGIRTSCGL